MQKMDFKAARKICQASNASLISPRNPQENTLIVDYLRAQNKVISWIDAKIALSYWHGANGEYQLYLDTKPSTKTLVN